jgi:hypothetical protein
MIGIIWTLIGVVLLGFYNGLLLADDKLPESDPKNRDIEDGWHTVGAAIFIYLAITAWIMFGWKYIPFTLACFWSLFAGVVHRVGLDKSFFFVGTTATTDKLLRKISSKKPELVSAILKLSVIIASIVLLFL